ncbi:hypothetical protein QN277_012846 [Acacia crassicarpa]|uniref:Uncharacterized protein n=1 Tax=Acacia crassicarpa TaxID=499986 RepID=A0AAE1N1H9_9FABA|nr:hypothetical protein QN277_012846 [Acacia crassicarpa]
MLLRSSSTPVLGSLLSSFSESPCNSLHFETTHGVKHLSPLPETSVPHHNHKLSFHQTGSHNLSSSFSSTSSPISPSIADLDRHRGFRRAQSEGNLENLAYASSCNKSLFALDTIPSFSFSNYGGLREEDDEEEEEESEFEDEEEEEGGSSAMEGVKSLIMTEEVRVENIGTCRVGIGEKEKMSVKEIHPAVWFETEGCGDGMGGCRGGGGGGGGGDFDSTGSGGYDGESRHEVEEYYKRMVEENPGNPLFLSNYAQFLYQHKRDHHGAEEYYSRAILADPRDGEILSRYGKLVWELHHDQDRASSYFERAVQASPQDSHVHAAYASFLWDTEEDDNGCSPPPPTLSEGAMLVSAGA